MHDVQLGAEMRRALATMGPAMAAELPPEKREVRVAKTKIVTKRNSKFRVFKIGQFPI